jgi:hypothetical protein
MEQELKEAANPTEQSQATGNSPQATDIKVFARTGR